MADQATPHRLTGCAIGEVLGMVIGTAAGLSNAATVVLSIAQAFVFGYGVTMRGVLRSGLGPRRRPRAPLTADADEPRLREGAGVVACWSSRAGSAVVDGAALSGGGCGTARCWPASAARPASRGCW